MRVKFLYPALAAFAAILINSCSPNDPVDDLSSTNSSNVVDPCATCQYEDLVKTVGNKTEVVGTVAICQTAENLTITFTVSGNRDRAWFNQTGIRIFDTNPNSLNPASVDREVHHGERLRSYTYTVALADIGEDGAAPGDILFIATYANVPGPDGTGGMVWAGNLTATSGNPNSRFFTYEVKQCETPEPPTAGCLFTQGYWFAKPSGQQWPAPTVTFAGQTYNYSEARAIFFGKNAKTGKTDAKQAFLQALALTLSLEGGAAYDGVEGCAGVGAALNDILAHFSVLPKVNATNINTSQFNTVNTSGISMARLREAAGIISDCLNTHHCNRIEAGDLVTN